MTKPHSRKLILPDTAPDYRYHFDNNFGYDLLTLNLKGESYTGHIHKSPIEARFIKKFGYLPVEDEAQKPFKAIWMVDDYKLRLGFVNGTMENRRINTDEMVPEFPDDEALCFYEDFTGKLILMIEERKSKWFPFHFQYPNSKKIILIIEQGVIIGIEENV